MMLKLKNLSVGYGNSVILHNINLNIQKKGLIGIIGKNGSGKSTLIKSIFNMCKIFSGEIIYEGSDIKDIPTNQRIRNGLIYVPQEKGLFPELSVEEHIKLVTVNDNKKDQVLKDLSKNYPWIKKSFKTKVTFLSGGQQRLLTTFLALFYNPKVIFFDEPTAGLDISSIQKMEELLKKLSKRYALVVVEQNQKVLFKLTKNVYQIKNMRLTKY